MGNLVLELRHLLDERNEEYGVDVKAEMDITNAEKVDGIRRVKPTLVYHCAAYGCQYCRWRKRSWTAMPSGMTGTEDSKSV